MFDDLSSELLKTIIEKLNSKDNRNLTHFSMNLDNLSDAQMRRRLAYFFEKKKDILYETLLECIYENEEHARDILINENFKTILLEIRPRQLPHWILGIADCHPKLLVDVLKEGAYFHSLAPPDASFLVNHYSQLLSENVELSHQLFSRGAEDGDREDYGAELR